MSKPTEDDMKFTHKMLKVVKVARELNVSVATIYKWIQTNRIKAIQLPSGSYRIPEDELERIKGNVVLGTEDKEHRGA